MKLMIKTLGLIVLLLGCQSDDIAETESNILSEVIANNTFEVGAVIACAASDQNNPNQVNVYFYPEPNASNYRLYETSSVTVDPNDFSNYTRVAIESTDFFNGFLRQYTRLLDVEKWIIVTFRQDGELKLSNPIRSKQLSKPSVFNQDITINQDTVLMPLFSWQTNPVGDNAIYFQIVSDISNNVFSATYTLDGNFQYYNTSNVVLNVTEGIPPSLVSGETYHFTLMDVSEDNWVNVITLNKNFTLQ